jgi:hypothetical protein
MDRGDARPTGAELARYNANLMLEEPLLMVRMQSVWDSFLRLVFDTAAVRLAFLTAFLMVRTSDWTDRSRISRYLTDWWLG